LFSELLILNGHHHFVIFDFSIYLLRLLQETVDAVCSHITL
jgi:hypothetical protein